MGRQRTCIGLSEEAGKLAADSGLQSDCAPARLSPMCIARVVIAADLWLRTAAALRCPAASMMRRYSAKTRSFSNPELPLKALALGMPGSKLLMTIQQGMCSQQERMRGLGAAMDH